jgi:tetratricopeptide (TPR) repeat protein
MFNGRPHSARVTAAKLVCLLLTVIGGGLGLAVPDAAANPLFREREQLVKLQDVEFKDLDGAELYLGYKYSYQSFIAPYRLTDDGYILGITGQSRYYALTLSLVSELQEKGQLPKPLPGYRIPIEAYVFGHALWLALSVFALSVYAATRGYARSRRAVPFANEGIALERAGNLDLAAAAFTKAIKADPKHIDILCRRASVYHVKGDHDLAIADFTKAMTLEPKNALALLGRGAAYEAKGLSNEAIEDYTRAIKISDGALAYLARGIACLGAGNHTGAIADFTTVLAKEPQLATAYQNRGLAYERSGKVAQSQADYKIAAMILAGQQEIGGYKSTA